MNIEELKQLKQKLKYQIMDAVNDYKEKTGLYPSISTSIQIIESINSIGYPIDCVTEFELNIIQEL